ncbi:hypothetical protein AB5J49_01660 [Streptomyces sp. R28]|uniref:Endonuclease n=1 Tax=Streptomyces sp. R28 TaxID=3238628 RepID=A0AB39PSQ1_9ACTN
MTLFAPRRTPGAAVLTLALAATGLAATGLAGTAPAATAADQAPPLRVLSYNFFLFSKNA